MTPLAHRIVKEMTLPLKRRTFLDRGKLLPLMTDIHCFEVSAIHDLALNLIAPEDDRRLKEGTFSIISSLQDTTSFLPAPRTWIEFCHAPGGEKTRTGALLFENGSRISFLGAQQAGDGLCFSLPDAFLLPRIIRSGERDFLDMTYDFSFNTEALGQNGKVKMTEYLATVGMLLHIFLAMINTPKMIGRRQHMPHRGLERELIAQQKVIGRFPLHAWTEIKLEVAVPRDLSEEAEHEDHLTGRKALHFCRAHLRHVNGALVFVRPHWRGDASLGIKRSRYKVVPPSTSGGAAHA